MKMVDRGVAVIPKCQVVHDNGWHGSTHHNSKAAQSRADTIVATASRRPSPDKIRLNPVMPCPRPGDLYRQRADRHSATRYAAPALRGSEAPTRDRPS